MILMNNYATTWIFWKINSKILQPDEDWAWFEDLISMIVMNPNGTCFKELTWVMMMMRERAIMEVGRVDWWWRLIDKGKSLMMKINEKKMLIQIIVGDDLWWMKIMEGLWVCWVSVMEIEVVRVVERLKKNSYGWLGEGWWRWKRENEECGLKLQKEEKWKRPLIVKGSPSHIAAHKLMARSIVV